VIHTARLKYTQRLILVRLF